jgi:hypothetical protein
MVLAPGARMAFVPGDHGIDCRGRGSDEASITGSGRLRAGAPEMRPRPGHLSVIATIRLAKRS